MLDALKQLLGLAPRDLREVWHEKPVVIVDADDEIVFSGLATVEYTPTAQEYEKGHTKVYDESNGDLVFEAEIVSQRVYSTVDQSNPYRLRWTRLGLTAKAVDAEGEHFTVFIGRHAHNYLLKVQGSALGMPGYTVPAPFPEEGDLEDPPADECHPNSEPGV